MPKKEDMGLYQGEVQASVSFTTFMTAMTMFFIGLLLTQFGTFNPTVRIPVLFLVISTFGFLYSTLIYANASGEIARFEGRRAKSHMFIGNVLSEYLGVYMLVLALPLVINAVTADAFLQFSVLITAGLGLALYSRSPFSIISRHLRPMPKIAFVAAVCAFEIALFLAQKGLLPYFTELSIIFLAFMLVSTWRISKFKE